MNVNLRELTSSKIAVLAYFKRQCIDQRMKALNLSRTQWQVLSRFNFLPQPCPQQALLKCLDIDRAHLTRTLAQLEKLKLLTRIETPTDRRARFINLTKQGQATQKKVEQILHAENELMLVSLSQEENDQFNAILDKLNGSAMQSIK